jgi:nucleotide-binding universal stress UspA family protein
MKILAAIDGSSSSLRGLRYVVSHAAMFGAMPDIVLVNVHLPIPSVRAKAVLGADVIDQYYREESETALAPAQTILNSVSCNVTEQRLVGDPASQIVAAAGQHGCDLIVMGTHGHSALGTLFMGSVAMRVIADSPVPVLMVK